MTTGLTISGRINMATDRTKFLKLVFSLLICFLLSCENNKGDSDKQIIKDDNVDLEIITRDKLCAYLIKYNKEGFGTVQKGDVDNFENDKYFFTKVITKRSFSIKAKNSIDTLKTIILKLNKMNFKSYKIFDANHLQVYAKKKKVIDAYSNVPAEYEVLEAIIIKNLPIKFDYNCIE
ncbi:hypothetical protein [Pedobacter aquatilis]|uniref:hypothetical protein n=1 Tax=Pedobacter aquatilis TaxID=351343 RepID=UPI00292F31FA|nr:hypothetical protein [Pedobacter aquatilis]